MLWQAEEYTCKWLMMCGLAVLFTLVTACRDTRNLLQTFSKARASNAKRPRDREPTTKQNKTCFVPNFLWRLALPLPLAHQGMTCRNIRKTYPPCVRCLYVTFCAWHSHFGLQINSVGGTWKIHRENVTGTDRPNRHHSVIRKGANEN